jgi:hypothetical protein
MIEALEHGASADEDKPRRWALSLVADRNRVYL